MAYRPSKRLTIAHAVRYVAALCGRHLVTHQSLKALMLEGNSNIPIQSQTTSLHDNSCKCNANHPIKKKQTTLLASLAPSPTHSNSFSLYCITNCIYQLITLKLRRLRSIVVIKCSSLFSYNTLIWTLILISQNSTPEYLTGIGELFSDVDRNVVCCDYASTILGGSYYSVILFQRFHV